MAQLSRPAAPKTGGTVPPSNWFAFQAVRAKRHPGYTAAAGVVSLVVFFGALTEALDGTFAWSLNRCRDLGVCAPPPPAWLEGTLSEVRLGAAHVPLLAAYGERGMPTPTNLTPEILAWPGRFITYRVEFRGLVGSSCHIQWTLFDAERGERIENGVHGFDTVHAEAFPVESWTVEADRLDAVIGVLWVPYVAPGKYVVEVELLDADDEYLDIERSPAFTVMANDMPA